MLNFVHNLRMDPASNYFRESVLNDVKKMSQEENIETSAFKGRIYHNVPEEWMRNPAAALPRPEKPVC